MDDLAPPVESTVMASLNSTRSSLSTLPVEMLDKIFRLVDSSDLVNLRLVSRSFCAIANRPFAVRYFTSCHHVFTQHSFETLLAISAHSVFGACIKKIMFSPARVILEYSHPYDEDDDDTVVDDSFVESGGFSDLMRKILVNIKRHSDSIAIGIHEDDCLGRGHHDPELVSPHRQAYHGERTFRDSNLGTAYRTSETLMLVVSEVHAAGISIKGLHYNSSDREFGFDTHFETDQVLARFLMSCDSPIDLCFTWGSNGRLEYDHFQNRLGLSSSSWFLNYESDRPENLFLQETVRWIANTSFSELHLRAPDIDYLPDLDMYFVQFLETVTLEELSLGSGFFAQDSYSGLFQRLSRLPNLKHCKLCRLHYALPLNGLTSYQHDIRILHSGQYSSYWATLLLVFPNGRLEFEIQGGDTLEKLKDLAAYTAAAERRKIHEVDAAGELTDCRVMGYHIPILEEEDIDYPFSHRPPVLAA
jgi:hypothetical protein